jgi:acetyl esterase/lipase
MPQIFIAGGTRAHHHSGRTGSDLAEILLFHHAHGQTQGLLDFALTARARHIVHTPDLFDGRRFDPMEEGMAFVEEVGFTEIIERGTHAADDLPNELVTPGSPWVCCRRKTRPNPRGSRGRCFSTPVSHLGIRVDLAGRCAPPDPCHGRRPIFTEEGDLEAARALVASAEEAELFLYPGNQHYFADASLPSYDMAATALLMERVLSFLDRR